MLRNTLLRPRALGRICLLMFLLAAAPPLLKVQADGGAPDLAYVAGSATGVSVIDIAQQRVSKTYQVGGDPSTVLLSLDGSLLYVAQPGLGRVSVVALPSGKTTCAVPVPGHPSLLALSPDERTLYIAGEGDTSVRMLNLPTCALSRQVFPAGAAIYGVALSFVGGAFPASSDLYQLWVATTDRLLVLDPEGRQMARFLIPAGPRALSIPTGDAVYATTGQGTVVAVDLSTHQVTPPLLSGASFGRMDYDGSTGEIYVPDLLHRQIDVLAPLVAGQRGRPPGAVRAIPVPGIPVAVAITSDGQLGFVALQGGNVARLDIPAHRLVNTVRVGGHPTFIITGLSPPPTTGTGTGPIPARGAFPIPPPWAALLLALALLIGVATTVAVFRRGASRRQEPR